MVRHPRRDALRVALAEAGIETLIHYETPPHLQAAYANLRLAEGALPTTEKLAREILSLPVDPCLGDVAIDAVIAAALAWNRAERRAA